MLVYSLVHRVEDCQAFPLLSPLKMDVSSQVEDQLRALRKKSFLATLGEVKLIHLALTFFGLIYSNSAIF